MVYLLDMAKVEHDTKLLHKKRGYWYYQRRVPLKYAHLDHRRYVCLKSAPIAQSLG